MMKKNTLFLLYFLLFWGNSSAQNTVGLLSYNANKTYEGYNLLFPHNQEKVFLLNNCGEIVHTWEDDAVFRPGSSVYLQGNGNLIKCKRLASSINVSISAGGAGGIVEIVDWDNNSLWSFEQNDSLRRLHHDIAPMANGNILMISWEYKSQSEAIQAGRDITLLTDGHLWPDYILEINPLTDEVVWEWHAWDHLIQNYDIEKDNFGEITSHPELIDINWTGDEQGRADWMHTNAIDYNEELDQIILSIPTFNEIWIIDHSTSTAEAVGHSGGLSGKGGDLLYRWGNPATYQAGTIENQLLFFQHDAHWVDNFVDTSNPYYGKIALFNNKAQPSYSTANVFAPVFDEVNWSYPKTNGIWGPEDFVAIFTHPQPTALFSAVVSSVQILPNGNTLICAGKKGYTVELTPENEIAWEYKTPMQQGQPVEQGTILTPGNITFRLKRYPPDYPAFVNRTLTPIGYIELNPDTAFCHLISVIKETSTVTTFTIFPNPATHEIQFKQTKNTPSSIVIFDYTGKKIHTFEIAGFIQKINISNWPTGLYFAVINGKKSLKFSINK